MFDLLNVTRSGVATGFLALTLIPGAWTLGQTQIAGVGQDVLQGSAQRLYEDRFEAEFPLGQAMRHGWAALKLALLGEGAEGVIIGPDGTLFTAEEVLPPSEPTDLAQALAAARAVLEPKGVELIPILVPDKLRQQGGALSSNRSERFRARYDQALQIIAQAGLRSVDLRSSLSGPGTYMRTDTHWSPLGARRAAAAVADLIGPEIATPMSFETVALGSAPFQGDLIPFVDAGPWRFLVGPSPEQIDQFDTLAPADAGQGLGLFDSADVPVVLVGTSFSARPAFHFPGFLKSALGADLVSYAQVGRGPFHPMDQYLASDDLAQSPPQFVLWELPERYLSPWRTDQ